MQVSTVNRQQCLVAKSEVLQWLPGCCSGFLCDGSSCLVPQCIVRLTVTQGMSGLGEALITLWVSVRCFVHGSVFI